MPCHFAGSQKAKAKARHFSALLRTCTRSACRLRSQSISKLFLYLLCLRFRQGEALLPASSSRSLSRWGLDGLPGVSALLLVRVGVTSSRPLMTVASMLLTALLCFLRFPAQPSSLLKCLPAKGPLSVIVYTPALVLSPCYKMTQTRLLIRALAI